MHLLLRPPTVGVPADAIPASARLARWLGQADAGAVPAPVLRDHAAQLAGRAGPVAWASVYAAAHRLPADRHWLWLEPVHLQVGLNNVGMAALAQALDGAALQAMKYRLEPLFADAGALLEIAAGRLLAGFPAPLAAVCVAPELACGANCERTCRPDRTLACCGG
jgi:hypothetical protein